MYKNRHFIRRFIDIPTWIGADQLIQGAGTIKSMIKESLSVSYGSTEVNDTFEEAVHRYNYSEAFLAARKRFLLVTSLIYFCCSLLLLIYSIYLYTSQLYMNSVTTICVTMILMSFSFRAHFWYTQIRLRTLGLTFSNWLRALFKDTNHASKH